MKALNLDKSGGLLLVAAVLCAIIIPAASTAAVIQAQCTDSWLARSLNIQSTCESSHDGILKSHYISYSDTDGTPAQLDLGSLTSFVQEQKLRGNEAPDFKFSLSGNTLTITSGTRSSAVDLTDFANSITPATTTGSKQTLALAGNTLRISGGNAIDLGTVLGLRSSAANTSATIGDVKSGIQATDHDGWIKLDGRALGSLSTQQQAAAATLGISASLPDASNAVLAQNGSALGTVAGANTRMLARNQLPNVTLDGTTDAAGAHSHSYNEYHAQGSVFPALGFTSIGDTSTSQTSTDGIHTHSFTTSSLNGNVTQQTLDITPRALSVNMFMYLGQ